MGEITVRGPQAKALLQRATCNDVSKLEDGRIHYNGLLYPTGGFVDDILIYRVADDDYFVVVNASEHRQGLRVAEAVRGGFNAAVTKRQRALRAAGPAGPRLRAPAAAADRCPPRGDEVLPLRDGARGRREGDRLPHRLTGEDGFEVYVDPIHASGSCGSSSRRGRSRAASAPATPCASRRRWRCTETTSTTPPRRSSRPRLDS